VCKKFLTFCSFLIFEIADYCCAQSPAHVIPTTPYDRHIIYQSLVLFWIGIIGLVIIIRIKIKEIKRIEDMDIHKEDDDAPFLD
jgi:hypothetical protein